MFSRHHFRFCFFSISGFFITKSFDNSSVSGRFVKARMLRIFPALRIALLVTVVVAGLWLTHAPLPEYLAAVPRYILRNLTLNSLVPELPGVFERNPFGDSISWRHYHGTLWNAVL